MPNGLGGCCRSDLIAAVGRIADSRLAYGLPGSPPGRVLADASCPARRLVISQSGQLRWAGSRAKSSIFDHG